VVRKLWQGKIVCFEVTFDGEMLHYSCGQTRSSCKSQMMIWASRSRELSEDIFSFNNFFSSS